MSGYDYAPRGRIGIGTPQANPTVEDELRILLPPAVGMSVTRLTSLAAKPEDRLRDYLCRLETFLDSFDTLKLDAFGFACTASSYLVDIKVADVIVDRCMIRRGYPIVTAADAIVRALDRLSAKKMAIISPYPAALAEAATTYWRRRGFEVTAVAAAGDLLPGADTRGIYALGSEDARRALLGLDLAGAEVVLFSGTGMPSLPLLASQTSGVPMLSSNLCLAAALCDLLGQGDPLTDSAPWAARCRAAVTH